MLNGIDPILIFHFSKNTSTDAASAVSKIPVLSNLITKVGLPPIPIYLSQKLTGLLIISEDKSVEIQTTMEASADGATSATNQKPINSTIRINIEAKRESIGLALISALADLILPKVVSQEYSITYLHGSTTLFGGLLHSFNVQQNSDDDRINITLELTKVSEKPKAKANGEVDAIKNPLSLNSGAVEPNAVPPTAPMRGTFTPPPASTSAPAVSIGGPG